MNTQHHSITHEPQPNIPLLDRDFDARSKEVDDFIISHTSAQNDDFYIIRFYETSEKTL